MKKFLYYIAVFVIIAFRVNAQTNQPIYTPQNDVQISPAYYVIGAGAGWSVDGARTQKFYHSNVNVYDDPIFTIVVDTEGDDCWFAIGDDEALNAIANDNDWSKLLGIKEASENLEGTMDYRYNLDGDHTFHITEAKKIRITLNMLEYSYKIEVLNNADAFYLIGGPGEWTAESAMTMRFNKCSADVFTYTFAGNGGTGDMFFAFGDKEAIDAVADDTWNKLFGTKGEGTDLSGSFDRRYNLDGNHEFIVDGTSQFYRISINISDMTYIITPQDFDEYIWEAGENNNWGSEAQPLYCSDDNGIYVGFFYAQDADWSEGKGVFKFTDAFYDWSQGNYGTGTINEDGLSGTLIDNNDSGNILVDPGFYRAEVDLKAMTYKLTPITSISIIGDFNEWGYDEKEMTYNPETHAWEVTADFPATEFKIRANHDWWINWGGLTDNLTQNGKNLSIDTDGTYFIQFFPLCETKSYCKIRPVSMIKEVNYRVISEEEQTVVIAKGDYGLSLDVPASFTANNKEWRVIGIETDALNTATDLAAIIWNPEIKFTEKISNPNLLLYVKSKDYAPSDLSNIIVENKAERIILTDAVEGNNFYCPQEFTAEQITYEHNYSMKTGYNSCQGWESIVLPFDVTVVTNHIGTELVPYSLWSLGDSKRPFWLCSMNEEGWKDESAIKANIPYIISMPNNENYDATYNITGNIVFSASNVTVQTSDNLVSSKHGHRNLVPNYQDTDRSSEIYALNVNNLWSTNTDSDLAEGSAFIRDSRQVRPFEAYMTIDSGGSTTRSINIFDDNETTGIMNLPLACKNKDGVLRVYSLSGMLLKQGKDEKILNDLPKGVYVVNGKKIVK